MNARKVNKNKQFKQEKRKREEMKVINEETI
jgi:hypothetical protein